MKIKSYKQELISSGILMSKASNFQKMIFNKASNNIYGEVLEVGAGTGNFSKLISKQCNNLDIIEVKKKSVEFLKKKLSKLKNIKIYKKDLFSLNKKKKYDSIVMFDVLEHIKEDERVIKKLTSILKKNGKLVVKVPAFNFLYSKYDRLIGHYKRYKKIDFLKMQNKLNFEIEDMFYFDPIGALGWWVNYCILKKTEEDSNKSTTSFQIKVYDKLLTPIIKFFDTKKNIFGVTLFVIIKNKKKNFYGYRS